MLQDTEGERVVQGERGAGEERQKSGYKVPEDTSGEGVGGRGRDGGRRDTLREKLGHSLPLGFVENVLVGKCVLDVNVGKLKAWSPDCPWLYTLVISLSRKGECVDAEACRLGLRTIQIQNGVLLANQMPVEVRGVNRHEHDHIRGKHVTRECMMQDIINIKKLTCFTSC